MMTLLAMTALAMPFDGCTFFKNRLARHSWPEQSLEGGGCANYQIEELACQITRNVGGVPVTYPGDRVSGRYPEYFLEVTPHFGTSIFTSEADGRRLGRQLDGATQFWKSEKNVGQLPDWMLGGTARRPISETENALLWHARALRVPYGVVNWSWPQIGVVATGAAGVPTCFLGISEHSPAVWSDAPLHPETWLAGVFNPLNLCGLPGVAQLNNRIDPPGVRPFEACSRGVRRGAINLGTAMPDSEVADAFINPLLSCAGRFGPLFPRTGWVSDANDDLTNAEKVAYKFASLARDHFISGPGVEAGDRWQIVWPRAGNFEQASCFVPGAERPVAELQRSVHLPQVPFTDGPEGENRSSIVIAVWRSFSKCVEPGQGTAWRSSLQATREARVQACFPNPLPVPEVSTP